MINTNLGIYAVKINPENGLLEPDQVQIVPTGIDNYSQLPSSDNGFVKVWNNLAYVETINRLYQVPLKDWNSGL